MSEYKPIEEYWYIRNEDDINRCSECAAMWEHDKRMFSKPSIEEYNQHHFEYHAPNAGENNDECTIDGIPVVELAAHFYPSEGQA